MDSIPSPQTILTMHDKLTMAMLPASVKNSQDYDSCDFLFCIWVPPQNNIVSTHGNNVEMTLFPSYGILPWKQHCFHL